MTSVSAHTWEVMGAGLHPRSVLCYSGNGLPRGGAPGSDRGGCVPSVRSHACQRHLTAVSCSLTNACIEGTVRNKSPEFLVSGHR